MTTAEIIRLAIALLPFLGTTLWWFRRLSRGRRILQFDRTKNLDVVITTSDVAPPKAGVQALRPLTGFGQVRGVASCTRAMSRLYPRKVISLHFSDFIRGKLKSDLVLLGGPGKNQVTRSFLNDFRQLHDVRFEFDDAALSISIAVDGQESFERNPFVPDMEDTPRPGGAGYPATDIGLIILSRRIGDKGRVFRCILCAGMTTYGTAAAADYLFGELVRMPRRRAWRLAGIKWFDRRRDMIIVVEGEFNEGEPHTVRSIAHFWLRPAKKKAKSRPALQPA